MNYSSSNGPQSSGSAALGFALDAVENIAHSKWIFYLMHCDRLRFFVSGGSKLFSKLTK